MTTRPLPVEDVPAAEPTAAGLPTRTSTRRRFADVAAAWLVRAGGVAVVVSLVGILAFLVAEVLPLLGGADAGSRDTVAPGAAAARHLVVDGYASHAAGLGADGRIVARSLEAGAKVVEQVLVADPAAVARASQGPLFAAVAADGRAVVLPVDFPVRFSLDRRVVTPRFGDPVEIAFSGAILAGAPFAVAGEPDDLGVAVQTAAGPIEFARLRTSVNDFTGETDSEATRLRLETPAAIRELAIDPDVQQVYATTDSGELLWWRLADGSGQPFQSARLPAPATALGLLYGGRSLILGYADGALEQWFRVPFGSARIELTRTEVFEPRAARVERVAAAGRDRSFAVQTSDGGLALLHGTSGRTLWSGPGAPGATALSIAPKGDALFQAGASGWSRIPLSNPHPEVGWKALFGRVWYEDHREPEWIWQSTGGSDEFEPKLSLTPLIVGTLKGTLYAMLLAMPLGILGAIYMSQFSDARVQRVVKPTIELMASLPSVVLGFVAGLWLAPRLERWFPGILALLVGLPVAALAAGALWSAVPAALRARLPHGSELVVQALFLTVAAMGCIAASGTIERMLFDGNFSAWLYAQTGLAYDQRNAIVAGIGMGFAVIPIVFALSDDALSNVPRSLSAGSLALGANRWQTVARVVLPAASPGIFAAVMIGLGRAVGETMIVLMATGNTPLLDWNAFNGFRTLSANIAVEIPEAPHGGTLYRTLFASALLLFAMTFVLNTVAELVRQRLRKRFSGVAT